MKRREKTPSVLDEAKIESLEALNSPGKDDLVAEISEIFLREVPILYQELQRAVQERTFALIQTKAHKLKGMCLNIGAHTLAKCANELEQQGLRKTFSDGEQQLAQFAKDYETVSAYLRERVRKVA